MTDEIYDVLDERGNRTGVTATWTEVHTKGLRHQGSCVFVFDTPARERLLVQKRSMAMHHFPGLFHVSAGGHARSGDTPEVCAQRELAEELFAGSAVPPVDVYFITSFWQRDMPLNVELIHIFECVYPGPFTPDPKEVASVQWVPWHELLTAVEQHPEQYLESFRTMLREYRKKTGR